MGPHIFKRNEHLALNIPAYIYPQRRLKPLIQRGNRKEILISVV